MRPVLLGVAMFVPVLLAAGLVLGEMSGYGVRDGAVPVGGAEEGDGTRSVAARQEISPEEEGASPRVTPSPNAGEAADAASGGGGSRDAVTAPGVKESGGVLAAPHAGDVWGPVLASDGSAGWRWNAVGVVEPTSVPEPPHADEEYGGVMPARYAAQDAAAAKKSGKNGPVSGTVEITRVERARTSGRSERSERGVRREPVQAPPAETAQRGTAQQRTAEARGARRTVRPQPAQPVNPAGSGHRCPAQWKDTWLWESCMERMR